MSVLQTPTWTEVKIEKQFPKLEQDLETDLVIIGGGLAGLLTAYAVAKAGKRVVVLEKDRVAASTTSYTTAFLTQVIDTDISEAKKIYGRRNTELILQSHGEGIDLIEKIVDQEKIDCEFMRCSNFYYINDAADKDQLEDECHIIKQFIPDIIFHAQPISGFPNAGCVEIKHQGKFHPRKFVNGLLVALEKLNVQIFEQTEVKTVEGDESVEAKTENNTVTAQYSLIATYDPLGNPKQTFLKKGMYVSYVYEVEIPHGLIGEGIYEDNNNPYHYFRIDRGGDHDRMIIGGEDNRREFEFDKEKNFKALRDYMHKILADHEFKITRKWSGFILEPSDGIALIGEYDHHRMVATAFSGNGMTYSAITAMIMRDIILKQKNPWVSLYDPKRTISTKQLLAKGRDYIGEFFGGVVKNTLK